MRETRPRFIVRPHLWLKADEPWECPSGHRLGTNAAVVEHDALICHQRLDRSTGECGLRVWARRFPDGRRYVAEISVAEFKFLISHALTADEVIAFLGGTPPRQAIA